MFEKENIEEIIYVDRKKYFNRILAIVLAYIILAPLLIKIPSLMPAIADTIYIVISFCIILLIKSTMGLYRGEFYKIIGYIYILIILLSSKEFLPKRGILAEIHLIGANQLDIESVAIFLISLGVYNISVYARNRKMMRNKNLFFLSILFIANIIMSLIGVGSIAFTTTFITLGMLILSYIANGNYKLIEKSLINYAKAQIILLVIICIVNLIESTNYLKVDISRLNILLSLTLFLINSINIIDKLLNNPYKMLFADLFNKNNYMNELNKKIIAKNRELEFSQVVIKKKENLLKTFFSNVPIPLLIINKESERISFANTNFMEFIGESNLKSVINRKLFSIITIDKNPFISGKNEMEKYIFRGSITVGSELKHIDIEFIDGAENSDGLVVIINDITSKVKIDTMRESMQNKILEEKLKRDFLSNISHDLKTPINVIYSATQLVGYYVNDGNLDGLRRYNAVSKQNCISLMRLANNLIDSSRISSDYLSANLERRNIVEIVEDVVTSLVDYSKSNYIDLIFDTNEEEVYINLDEDFMKRIVLNLIANAIKFTNAGGRIEVTIEDNGKEVSVFIRDNGVGMEEDFIKDAFSRYSMGKNNEGKSLKGTGIGLFVVKKLVEKQKGKIHIDSLVNYGTNIEIVFNKEV